MAEKDFEKSYDIATTDFSKEFNTPIPSERQKEYKGWLEKSSKEQNRDVSKDIGDYDIQGFFVDNEKVDEKGHGTDKFKKPNHPTFSNESKYHGVNGMQGGNWSKDNEGNDHFHASEHNVRVHGEKGLSDYFKKYEKGITLHLPGEQK